MIQRTRWSAARAAMIAVGVVLAAAATPAMAQVDGDGEREGNFELFVLGQYSSSDTIDVSGIDFEYEDNFSGGIGIGINPSDNLNVNLTLLIGQATASVDLGVFGEFEDDATFISPELNLDWNILDRSFTPFVTAGIGAMIFTGFDDIDDTTEFTYGGGGGIRWDFAENAFLKVWYRAKWFDVDDADDSILTHTANISIGWMR
jgi:opacity protein-like surface antigen